MGENKGDSTKKQPQHQQQQQPPPPQPPPPPPQQSQQQLPSSPKNPLEESSEKRQHQHQLPPPPAVVVSGAPFISTPVFVPIGATSSSPFEQQFEPVNPKRQRYNTSHQWKLLPSPSQQQKQTQMGTTTIFTSESTPSPTTNPTNTKTNQAASSSDTASSPPHSPIPSLSAASGQETSKPETGDQQFQAQFRKGKYVSPVWKPNEMLWLARAWRVQYQSVHHHQQAETSDIVATTTTTHQSTRGKTRAEKDREVAEFLQRHGVNRDAKTAGTKWDNMLGEFRKVYEWERGNERDQIGKSYFRLSPYERKLHRLPASFDEEVFEELSHFMGSRIRSSSSQSRASVVVSAGEDHRTATRALPPPPPLKEDDLSARTKQLVMTSGGGLLGFDQSLLEVGNITVPCLSSLSSSKELRRKVYEWERGNERDQIGKSYFRLSPYERKLHRLPASFDEEVFEELSHFMGSRIRSSSSQSRASVVVSAGEDHRTATRALPPPPPLKEDDLSARTKQLVMTSGGGLLGFDQSLLEVGNITVPCLSSLSSSKELRRIGKIRMTWEESVSLWAEEGENQRGRVRLQGSSFLNADELTFFDDAMVACNMEAFEEGTLRGFSVDRFLPGQQVKVFGRRKSSSSSASASSSGFIERFQLPFTEQPSIRSIPPYEFQDPTDYYVGCLRVPPTALPSLFELSWHLQEPPPEELRFPLRRDVYRDLPQGKELFFTTSTELLDSRAITYDILSPIIRNNPSLLSVSTATSRDSFIGLWDDCINRVVSKFCSVEMVIVRKPSSIIISPELPLQDQWPNVTGFVRNFCLWRGEECDQLKEGYIDPSCSIVEKLLWTYMDLPYLLGYYAVGYIVTFCALSRSQDRVIRTDLYSIDLSSPAERLKALIPCYRIAGLLPLLADRCFNNNNGGGNYRHFSDFERIDLGNGNVIEMTPTSVTRFFSSKRKWTAVKEIYDFLDHRIPHAESIYRSSEKDLALVFKPRGCKIKPSNCDQLVEVLQYVTKALVALHDLSFMHRDLSWDKVMRRSDRDSEWFVCGFEESVGAPKIHPHGVAAAGTEARGRHAPEMGRGLHGVKVDVWGVGQLVKTCGLSGLPKMLRELQNRCLEQNPEQRPTAADCYHHLLQLQSSTTTTVPY